MASNKQNRNRQNTQQRALRQPWSQAQLRELRGYSKAKTPAAVIAKKTGRTEGAIRQKGHSMGFSIGHRR